MNDHFRSTEYSKHDFIPDLSNSSGRIVVSEDRSVREGKSGLAQSMSSPPPSSSSSSSSWDPKMRSAANFCRLRKDKEESKELLMRRKRKRRRTTEIREENFGDVKIVRNHAQNEKKSDPINNE